MKDCKAFVNHKPNGVYLKFPNGNGLSTIWGCGTYSDNHNYTTEDIVEGANRVEIMIETPDDKLCRKIFRKLDTSPANGVIGWVTMEQWLWVVNQLSGRNKN